MSCQLGRDPKSDRPFPARKPGFASSTHGPIGVPPKFGAPREQHDLRRRKSVVAATAAAARQTPQTQSKNRKMDDCGEIAPKSAHLKAHAGQALARQTEVTEKYCPHFVHRCVHRRTTTKHANVLRRRHTYLSHAIS